MLSIRRGFGYREAASVPAALRRFIVGAGLAIGLLAAVPATAATCADLTALAIKDTVIHSATRTRAPFDAPENGMSLAQDGYSRSAGPVRAHRAFCRLQGYSRPTSDSFIQFEIWLPDTWNGKFQAVGSGKVFGAINYRGLAEGLDEGYAVVSTDSGHVSNRSDLSWALGHPEKVIDLFYRGDYVSTLAARAALKAFYGRDPDHSYYVGCARGGTSGIQMAVRYPDLFDGIYAGSPGTNSSEKQADAIWMARWQLLHRETAIPDDKFAMIALAVVKACDGDDGLVDGQITDPTRCGFQPAQIACHGPDGPDCLTAPQVATLEKLYAGAVNPRTHAEIYVGRPAKGSEAGWPYVIQSKEMRPGFADTIGIFIYQRADWDWTKFNFDKDLSEIKRKGQDFYDIPHPDLRRFGEHGKMIITHGWQDPLFSPLNAIQFYEDARSHSGGDISRYVQLFTAPAMGHCGGGSGPNAFDPVAALDAWVAGGVKPQTIIATKFQNDDPTGKVLRTRPLCPYPKHERYKGSGDINRQESFYCQ